MDTPTDTKSNQARPLKLLIVDDDQSLLGVLKNGLQLHGYSCETIDSAVSALELVERDSFDILIVDIVMPDMNGLELTAKVKNIRPRMTVIVITGRIEDFPYDRAIEAGASDFIKKPFP